MPPAGGSNKFYMKAKLTALMLALAFVVGLTSCDNNDGPARTTYLNFMTLVSTGQHGSTLEMTTIEGKTVMFTCTGNFAQSATAAVTPGQRVLVLYEYPDNRELNTSGPINVLAYSTVINGAVEWGPANQRTLDVRTQALTITGNYLNFEGMAMYFQEPGKMRLIADETTANDSKPVVYLLYESDNDTAQQTMKAVYASVNISAIWNDPKYDGFVLRIPDVNSSLREVTFNKPAKS